jgi:cation diffusion facilitator CzcD-associated flavoprotein CzcO
MKELWADWDWSERFPGWEELRDYFSHVDKKLNLSKDIRFNSLITECTFDPATDGWTAKCEDGTIVKSHFLSLNTGFAHKKFIPNLPGLETFKGESHHTALWPQTGLDMNNKRVAIIGTGSSGVQIFQEASKVASHVTLFQRTPNLALPMVQVQYSKGDKTRSKEQYPEFFNKRKETFGGFGFDFIPKNTMDDTPERRQEVFEELWQKGGFHFWLAAYQDLLFDHKANDEAYAFWCKKVRARLNDTRVADILAPTKKPYAFGTKRPSLEQNYYDCFNQENTYLVDLRAEPILEITPTGIKTDQGFYEADVLVLATGFDAVTGGLNQIKIQGTNGQLLKDKWSNGSRTYLGMTSAGFPNLFFTYGPQGPTAFCNGPTCAEVQGDWIVDCIQHMKQKNLARVDATKDAEEKWKDNVANLVNITLFPETKSWYFGDNIPEKPRESLNYAGGVPRYLDECKDCARNGYTGFVMA